MRFSAKKQDHTWSSGKPAIGSLEDSQGHQGFKALSRNHARLREYGLVDGDMVLKSKISRQIGQSCCAYTEEGDSVNCQLISTSIAIELLRSSPSVRSDDDGTYVALRRVFVLPEFEIPRAALVVERYLETLSGNAQGRIRGTTLLLERSSYVPEIDLGAVSPILRDIKERGTAFMDSTDGEIEACRLRRPKRGAIGEVGVAVFAWTKPKSRPA